MIIGIFAAQTMVLLADVGPTLGQRQHVNVIFLFFSVVQSTYVIRVLVQICLMLLFTLYMYLFHVNCIYTQLLLLNNDIYADVGPTLGQRLYMNVVVYILCYLEYFIMAILV